MKQARSSPPCFFALLYALVVGSAAVAAPTLVFPGANWEEATPESQGVDGKKLDEAASLLARTVGSNGVHELVIIRHGRMIWKGDAIDKRHGVWSATKSFTSTVLGLLIEDDKCALDTRVADVLPELKAHYPEVTLRHFTTMTSGYRAVGDETTGSYKHGPSNTPFQPNPLPLFTPPGSQYAYWDSAMNTLALALTKIAGEPIEELFHRRVAQPIGMKNWDWGDYATVDGVIVNGGSGNANKHIFITAREMARFGLLFLNGGNWNGRQLVSAQWVAEATRVQVPASMPWAHPESDIDGRGVYGFNWWRNGVKPAGTRKFPGAPEGMFWASGHNNNKCFVIPEWNMVVVRLGLDGRAKDEVWDKFLAKIGEAVDATGKSKAAAPPSRIKVGVVQMALGRTIADNRDRIVSGIGRAAARGVRVTVFPEGALRGNDGDNLALVDEAVAAIRRAAREQNVYVVFGGASFSPSRNRDVNWMRVIGPDGGDVFRYDKLYDKHDAQMPGVFRVDGVSCGTMICADRWLRGVEEIPIQQGAQISFELSCNFASEWVAPFGWYWYVPRALRNNVWVLFANTGNKVSGVPDDPAAPRELRHGHSAIIAPDGRIVAAARDDVETIVVAELDVSQATRATAQARATHPALRPFWEAGGKLQNGQAVGAPPWTPLKSAETDITIAAAQVTEDLTAMEAMVTQASAKHADLVVFPERAIAWTALDRLQAAAREHRITVVVGMEHPVAGSRRNSAFVIGPEGAVLTRYDQLSAASPFQPGDNPAAMWFRVKGVPAVVTIGRDALWSELAELAAVAGAQVHIHLDHDPANDPDAALRQLQVWSNLASFQTFSATVNVVGSAIWDDLRDLEERRAEVRDLPRPKTGPVEVYSPFSANLVVRAGAGPQLIVVTRRVGPKNQYHPGRTSSFNPQMDAWYRLGAAIVQPSKRKEP